MIVPTQRPGAARRVRAGAPRDQTAGGPQKAGRSVKGLAPSQDGESARLRALEERRVAARREKLLVQPTAPPFLRGARLVVVEVVFGTLDVLLLRPFISSAKEENYDLSKPGEVHAITRPPINPELHYAFAYRLRISEVAGG